MSPGLRSTQQLRVVTSFMQNVTAAPRGRGSVIALLNAPLYTGLLIAAPLARGSREPGLFSVSWMELGCETGHGEPIPLCVRG